MTGTASAAVGPGSRLPPPARRVAVVGVDGSGKSTLVRRLARDRADPTALVGLHCPDYHETDGAPLAELSRHLHRLSRAADELGDHDLKLLSLYLRMTLFGPVEHHLVERHGPTVLVSDRHPIVDTLVYLPLYRSRVRGHLDLGALDLRRVAPDVSGMADVWAWERADARRSGSRRPLPARTAEIAGLLDGPWERVLAGLGHRYRTSLPDRIVLLDVDPAEGARRREGRTAGSAELHEREAALDALGRRYTEVTDRLARECGIEVERLSTSGRSADDSLDSLREIVDRDLGRTTAAATASGAGP